MAYFDDKPEFGELALRHPDGTILRTYRTLSFNTSPIERVTLLDPVLMPDPNSLEVKVDGQTVVGNFRVRVAGASGVHFHRTAAVAPSVTCGRKNTPHAKDSHGEGFPCTEPKEVQREP